MATPASAADPVDPESLINIKVLYCGITRRFKIPLKHLGSSVFPEKLRQLLVIPSDVNVIFERYSDTTACYVRLDDENVGAYKQLYRAAKTKFKLRIKVIVVNLPPTSTASPTSLQRGLEETPTDQKAPANGNDLLDSPLPLPHIGDLPTALAPASSSPSIRTDTIVQSSSSNDVVRPRPLLSSDDANSPFGSLTSQAGPYCINCNNCSRYILGEHYHCNICDGSDFDLCKECRDAGVSCPGGNHWLLKRFVKNGVAVNSATETISSWKLQATDESKGKNIQKSLPELVPDKVPEPSSVSSDSTVKEEKRACNGCLEEHDVSKMVACNNCNNCRLCVKCLFAGTHGHHPAHSFSFTNDRQFALKSLALSYCQPGRRYRHAAACDGCDKRIVGVRHKCLTCPDWDYCGECILNAPQSHPGHRFVSVYESVADRPLHHEVHDGILCDGPLCKDKETCITGIRYKCSVCYDLDFCAKCEAFTPNPHNRTHPLIKYTTPIRRVTASATADGARKQLTARESRFNRPIPSPDDIVKPTDDTQAFGKKVVLVRETVTDGTKIPPNEVFQQTWTLHNPGPFTWPAGSNVRFVGGDSMFNIDTDQLLNREFFMSAVESNKLSAPLEPGHDTDFTVTLKSPKDEGTVISYWRLKFPDGTGFGGRLWCDIRVVQFPFRNVANEQKPMINTSSEACGVGESGPTGSAMVFPLLDKESQTTNTHEETTKTPLEPTVSNASEKDILEDVEDLTLEDKDTENGFLTDEEYDILNASDQEFLDAGQVQK